MVKKGRKITQWGLFVRAELERNPGQPNRTIAEKVIQHFPELRIRGKHRVSKFINNRRYLDNRSRS